MNQLVKRFRENKARKKPFLRNIKDVLELMHTGKKTYFYCLSCIVINYFLYRHSVSCETWTFALSCEYLGLEIMRRITSKYGSDFV